MTEETPTLSADARRALEWIRDNDHHRSRWMVDGKPVTNQPHEAWNMIEISGDRDIIRIMLPAWNEIKNLVEPSGGRDRIFRPNAAGRAALEGPTCRPGEHGRRATDRTATDYAIEFGEYLAKAAEHYRDVMNVEDLTRIDPVASREAFSALNSAIYEFRKRAARATGVLA